MFFYKFQGGFLGLGYVTEINKITVHLEGTIANVRNLTIHNGGLINCHLSGSTASEPQRTLAFNETVRVMAGSSILMYSPNAHADFYTLKARILIIEGGARISARSINILAENLTIDDGGVLTVDNGGHLPTKGPGSVATSTAKRCGAGHGGAGGRGDCGGYRTCRLRRGVPYGNMYFPTEYGSGGDGARGGIGGGVVNIQLLDTLQVTEKGFQHCIKRSVMFDDC